MCDVLYVGQVKFIHTLPPTHTLHTYLGVFGQHIIHKRGTGLHEPGQYECGGTTGLGLRSTVVGVGVCERVRV